MFDKKTDGACNLKQRARQSDTENRRQQSQQKRKKRVPSARFPVGQALLHHPELIQRWPSQKGLLWPLSKNLTSSFPSQTSYSFPALFFLCTLITICSTVH